MVVLYILLALLIFGFMILFHELGHFIFAKIFKVEINEFSIGMGPKLISWLGKDGVKYSLRALPIGGYVAMEGEEERSDNPNAYNNKPAWQRFIIVIAGALVNLLVGSIIMICLTISTSHFGTTTVSGFGDSSLSDDYGLQVNDEIVKINGNDVFTYDELSYEIMHVGYKPVSVTVKRNGETLTLDNVVFPTMETEGVLFGKVDFNVYIEQRSFGAIIKNSFFSIKSSIKMVWDSLIDLITGRYGLDQISGPIGVTTAIGDAAQFGAYAIFYMIVVISMNLGIFNLLPIPALDGGTLVFLLIEMIFKKPIPEKVERGLRATCLILLLSLVLVVTVKDVIHIFI